VTLSRSHGSPNESGPRGTVGPIVTAIDALPSTGGGGGGNTSYSAGKASGSGGSGVVIIRYPITEV
jgi:hypothetical protein